MKILVISILVTVASMGWAGDHAALTLDQGKKWIANAETHSGMQTIQKLVTTAPQDDDLLDQLDREVKTIIQKCTMKGAAHDQLHHVLHPIIQKVNALKTATNQEQNQLLEDIKALTETYFAHFHTEES